MDKLSPHPSRDKWTVTKDGAEITRPWSRYFEELNAKLNALISPAVVAGTTSTTLWSDVDKSGSSLVEIEIRNHEDLQNLNTDDYTHLSASAAAELTSTTNTALHYHTADRIYASNYTIYLG
jgi:hypothetical protein